MTTNVRPAPILAGGALLVGGIILYKMLSKDETMKQAGKETSEDAGEVVGRATEKVKDTAHSAKTEFNKGVDESKSKR